MNTIKLINLIKESNIPKVNRKNFLIKIHKLFKGINKYALLNKKDGHNIYTKTINNTTLSNWIFDFRNLFMKNDYLGLCGEIFWDIVENNFTGFDVATLEIGGIPFLSSIIIEGNKRGKNTNGYIIRKERKVLGLAKNIEGDLSQNKKPIILIDDLINSGGSLEYSKKVLIDAGYEIILIFTFVNISPNKNYNLLGINNTIYLFDINDFNISNGNNHKKIKQLNFINKKIIQLDNSNPSLLVYKSNPLYDKNYIYLGGEGGSFVKINYEGKKYWEYKIQFDPIFRKNILSSPSKYKNMIIFGAYDGNLYFLNANTGKANIINTFCDFIGSSPSINEKDGIVYVGGEFYGSMKGGLVSIDVKTGNTIWNYPVKGFIHSSPIYIENKNFVVIGTNCGKVICLNSYNGNLIWEFKTKADVKMGFRYYNNLLFFGSIDNYFYCLNIENGSLIRKYKTGNSIYTNPLILGDEIFFGSLDKSFYHLNVKGQLINKIETKGKIFAPGLNINNKYIAFATTEGKIYFYNFSNKDLKYYYQHNERITTGMYYDGKKNIYYYDFMNSIYKLDISILI